MNPSPAKYVLIGIKLEKEGHLGVALEGYLVALKMLEENNEYKGQFACLQSIIRLYRMVNAEKETLPYLSKIKKAIKRLEKDPQIIKRKKVNLNLVNYIEN